MWRWELARGEPHKQEANKGQGFVLVKLLTNTQLARQLSLRGENVETDSRGTSKRERAKALSVCVKAEVEAREAANGPDDATSDDEIDRLRALGFGPVARTSIECTSMGSGSSHGLLDGPDVYQVEHILDVRDGPSGREVLIKWEGWGKRFNSWEPDEHIIDRNMLQKFLRKRSRAEAVPTAPRIRSKRSSAHTTAEKARLASNADEDSDSVGPPSDEEQM